MTAELLQSVTQFLAQEKLSEELRRLRLRLGLSEQHCASEAGIKLSSYRRYESAKRRPSFLPGWQLYRLLVLDPSTSSAAAAESSNTSVEQPQFFLSAKRGKLFVVTGDGQLYSPKAFDRILELHQHFVIFEDHDGSIRVYDLSSAKTKPFRYARLSQAKSSLPK